MKSRCRKHLYINVLCSVHETVPAERKDPVPDLQPTAFAAFQHFGNEASTERIVCAAHNLKHVWRENVSFGNVRIRKLVARRTESFCVSELRRGGRGGGRVRCGDFFLVGAFTH